MNIQISDIHSDSIISLKNAITSLTAKCSAKFQAAQRIKNRFELKNCEWLNSNFNVPTLQLINDCYNEKACYNSTIGFGRPIKEFEDKSDRSKRREAATISAQHNHDPWRILAACRYAARRSGEKDLSSTLNELSKNPERPKKIRKLLNTTTTEIIKKTPLEALGFILDHSVSRYLYTDMRLQSKSSGADIWPPYDKIREAKAQLRPPKETIFIDECVAKVPLQALLNHTAERLVLLQKEVVLHALNISNLTEIAIVLSCSWGFDGSSGFSSYKQQYKGEHKNENVSDENLFATTLIPLRLSTENGLIIWNNNSSQSERFCRPIELRYIKESKNVILQQKEIFENEIKQLQTLKIVLDDRSIFVHFALHLTLIDGKVLAIITNTSMQSCPICHATPKNFNDLSHTPTKTLFEPDPKSFQFGISPLHAWIRFLECCLHIAYRLDIQKWQVRLNDDKIKFAERKAYVQKIIWGKLGLKVDMPKPGGSGTSNDGNTARRAFQDPALFATCLGLKQTLIENFRIILIALSCKFPLNANLFEEYCRSTAEIYVSEYKWYPMPPTVHKILMHSGQIIRNSAFPLGMLGEEASEARNKNYKNFREFHSRKHSRIANLTDMFNRALDSSDPVLSTMCLNSRIRKRKQLSLPHAVRNLLLTLNVQSTTSEAHAEEVEAAELDWIGLSETDEQQLDKLELSDEECEC
ncbi:PREDICTED: uncharacterized protein LOC105564550 [Vollenhovia emeryi]|uniref:uncharacterized protein LOC105564550 n=1 Tax=Vollenhovia emeryi TaxID=411798 RepID=UPI0005F4CC47|nr:PREDICTED: uncharacterized protein LOC105564550 [Vollenhovia emeryi]